MTGKERDSRLRYPMISADPPGWMATVMALKSSAMAAIVPSPNRHMGGAPGGPEMRQDRLALQPIEIELTPPPTRSPVRAGALPPARGSDRHQ